MSSRGPALRRAAVGVAAAGAFAVVYLLLAPPARRWAAESVAAPVLASIPAAAAPGVSVLARADPPSVIVGRSGTQVASYSIPLGVLFFIPALLLLVVAPERPYWLLFAAYLLVLGLLDLGAVAAGIQWGRAGFVLHEFLDAYVIRPTSIGVPLLILHAHRRRTR